MLSELQNFIYEVVLPRLVDNPATVWHTLEVLYEAPRVERVWTQLADDRRLLIHRIHPCDQAFYHPHTTPSAVLVLSGRYRMRVGYGDPAGPPPPVASTVYLTKGGGYEMLDPFGWHDVSPEHGPSISLMLTGKPWRPSNLTPEQRRLNRPLHDTVKREILELAVRGLV